jgi:hypothetical protein
VKKPKKGGCLNVKFRLIGKNCLKWSPTTFGLDRAPGEHGWKVALWQPSVAYM